MIRPLLRDALDDGTFRFRLGLVPVDVPTWFAARAEPSRVGARGVSFDRFPERLATVDDDLVEVVAGLRSLGATGDDFVACARSVASDLFVVRRSDARLVALAVAFPSGFAPEPLLDVSVRAIHAVVPGLEEALGPAIDGFLARVPVGRGFARVNAGLAPDGRLDRHPRTDPPSFGGEPRGSEWVVRLEEQLFVGLEAYVLFAVHLVLVPFVDLSDDERRLVARWAGSMPEAVARYKGLTPILPQLSEHA